MEINYISRGDAKYCTYVLLDHTKKGIEINNICFEHEPFYVGCGLKHRPRQSITEAIQLDPNSAKSERIMNIVTHSMTRDKFVFTNPPIIRIAGYFETKQEALYLETTLLNIIPKNLLTNSLFPYMKKDKIYIKSPYLFYGYHLNKLKMQILDDINSNAHCSHSIVPQNIEIVLESSNLYSKEMYLWSNNDALEYCGFDTDLENLIELYHELNLELLYLFDYKESINPSNFDILSLVAA